ncbi:IclR family transcriptional regulator [Streptomyces sp. NBC_00873]|uniref:IclR family transcriptional regulator n=1 Tax=unclassified Streptomyces TaxID=2593676 RepID=UPI0022511E58|nr:MULTISPECIES: IclR family transcriptional regulator [unclassified Streptomyces]WSY96077.1 IclR family transcriptional regulator [Streptomyces sp. NBC_00873]WTA42142.1 IclR family transcriptional regulator [Streptomyces sp. NBC_00842]MCX4538940.1 IclR family transcriptional regulator [Streptomyces sp. NBC_01669]WSA04827.1 IclR family transcriptional regulator [Streptomyces sp. NBC_00841]WSJ92323.1 IclR family transcriptional regulator [Streptomyces sp. NBC_01320]
METSDDGSVPPGRDSSFGKGLSVLARVLTEDGIRADALAAALDLPLSSTYRYLRTLREYGFVSEAEGAFRAGPRLPGRTSGPPADRIAELAEPFLQQLADATGETVTLIMRLGHHGICARQVESTHQIRLAFQVGQLLPLYAGAGERVLLAFAPEPVVRGVLQTGLRAFTPDTPDREEVLRLLKTVRAQRFAISRGELTPGAVSLAVPVLVGHEAVAALCVAGPRNRCPSTWQLNARRELDSAAQSLAQVVIDGR